MIALNRAQQVTLVTHGVHFDARLLNTIVVGLQSIGILLVVLLHEVLHLLERVKMQLLHLVNFRVEFLVNFILKLFN